MEKNDEHRTEIQKIKCFLYIGYRLSLKTFHAQIYSGHRKVMTFHAQIYSGHQKPKSEDIYLHSLNVGRRHMSIYFRQTLDLHIVFEFKKKCPEKN